MNRILALPSALARSLMASGLRAFFLMILAFAYSANAQLQEFQGQIVIANTTVWGYIRILLQGGCFMYAVYLVYQAVFTNDKQGAWMRIFGLIAFIVVLQYMPALYATVTGSDNPVQ